MGGVSERESERERKKEREGGKEGGMTKSLSLRRKGRDKEPELNEANVKAPVPTEQRA